MKRFIYALIALLVWSYAFAQNQQLADLIRESEKVKTECGQNAEQYLSALDSILNVAIAEKDFATVYEYRKIHCSVVKAIRGNSLEYALDLYKLGNVLSYIPNKESERKDAFEESVKSLEALNATATDWYIIELWYIFDYYRKARDLEAAVPAFYKWRDALPEKEFIERAFERGLGEFQLGMGFMNQNKLAEAAEHFICSESIIATLAAQDHKLYEKIYSDILGIIPECFSALDMLTEAIKYKEYHIKKIIEFEGVSSNAYYEAHKRLALLYAVNHEYTKERACYDVINDWIASTYGAQSFEYEQFLSLYSNSYSQDGNIDKQIEYLLLQENILDNLLKQGNKPEIKQEYLNVLNQLAFSYQAKGNPVSEHKYRLKVLEVLKNDDQTSLSNINEAFIKAFSSAISASDFKNAEQLKSYIENQDLTAEQKSSFIMVSFNLAVQTGNYKAAKELSTSILEREKNKGEEHLMEYVAAIVDVAQIYHRMGETNDAQSLLSEGWSILNSDAPDPYGLKPFDIALYNDIQGVLLADLNPTEALKYNDISLKKWEEVNFAFVPIYYAGTLVNRGMILSNLGKFEDSKTAMAQAMNIYRDAGNTLGGNYLSAATSLHTLQLATGDIAAAGETLDETRAIANEYWGESSEKSILVDCASSLYYYNIGDFEMSLKYSQKAVDKSIAFYGEQPSAAFRSALLYKGNALLALNHYDDAISTLSDCLDMYSVLGVSRKSAIAECNQSLGVALILSGRESEGRKHIEEAKQILEQVGILKTAYGADLLISYANALLQVGDKRCRDIYLQALNLAEECGFTSSPIFLSTLSNYIESENRFGKKRVTNILPTVNKAFSDQYKRNIALLPSFERQKFLSEFDGLTNNLFSMKRSETDNGFLYDYLLMTKGLQLGTSVAFARSLENSTDPEVCAKYSSLKSINSRIRELVLQPTNANIVLTDSLRRQSVKLEGELISISKEYTNYSHQISQSWTDLKKDLAPNTALIEFVEFKNETTKAETLGALMISPSKEYPIYINLGFKKDIAELVSKTPGDVYSKGTTARILFEKLWKPIAKYVREGDKIYFSPSGIINTVAIENLLSDSGERLGLLYELHRVSSTKEIHTERPANVHSAAIYGGLKYDMSPDEMLDNSMRAKNVSSNHDLYNYIAFAKTRSGWTFLPGTKTESDKIAEILNSNNVNVLLLQEAEGNEESFKGLSGKDVSIVHLATHGFYLENNNATTTSNKIARPLYAYKDPMIRSGLLLSGANSAWTGKLSAGYEDGILTSAEIAELNLSNTDIVVLSACDTGLGEITEEGVYGLQRAFKNAGVGTIVMSLWKVDDEATRQLMITFYSNLLSGMSKFNAFESAKNVVASKYSDPYYWAGFIMLD